MEIQILSDAQSVASRGAHWISDQARQAIAKRGRFILGVSGGRTPGLMLRALAREEVQWDAVDIVQIDERIAPDGDPDRNLTGLREYLRDPPAAFERVRAMPVVSNDLSKSADDYARLLRDVAGSPPVLDVAHLGLGNDGHTASLVPGDPVLEVDDTDVALTGEYKGRRRMTLTFPMLNRSRRILWIVTGGEKAEALRRLRQADQALPAGRIQQEHALILADRAAQADVGAIKSS